MMGENTSKKSEIKTFIIEHRKTSLLLFGLCGLGLAILAYCYLPCVLLSTEYRLKTSLVMLILALPTVFLIWVFRTHDIQEQIQEARKSNQFNNFANALKLFVEKENIEANSIGLKLLMEIKHQELYGRQIDYGGQIDLATRNKNLQGAKLQRADLQKADLQRADLQKADLQKADLQEADLQGAFLQRANLQEADLQKAFLSLTDLQEADLQKADLISAKLQGANLISANLKWAKLQGANLQGADLISANLKGADLKGADLISANLKGANLISANLISADLQGANLQGANLQGAKYDDNTTFPDDFNPKKHGMIRQR